MKEYKVVTIKGSMTSGKFANKAEEILNEHAADGWELKLIANIFAFLEREK